MPPIPTLPRQYRQNRHSHRILNHAGDDGILSVGFLPHPTGGGYSGVFPRYGALLLLDGSGIYRDDRGNTTRILPGAFIQRLPDRWHETTVTPDGKWMECYITFGLPLYHALVGLNAIDTTRPVLWPGVRLETVETFYRLLYDLHRAADNDLPLFIPRIIQLAAELTWGQQQAGAHNNAAAGEYDREIERVSRALAENFERDIRLPQLLKGTPVSYERFRKLFKEKTGLSPGEYRIRRRLERAVELLHAGELRIYQIADQLGYPDAYAFSKQFTRFLGKSPRQYRKDTVGSRAGQRPT